MNWRESIKPPQQEGNPRSRHTQHTQNTQVGSSDGIIEDFEDIEEKIRVFQLPIDHPKSQAAVPALCRDCPQLEIIPRNDDLLVGCVHSIESGPWISEWKRLPSDLSTCIQVSRTAERSGSP